jgi:protoheme IX farnesyltransferase
LATSLTLFAILFYVIGYTLVLKPRTSQNIVWGGIAGCMPVLIGCAAITNRIDTTAMLFFLVIFFWTPPHFWALAIKHKSDYAAADFPMLPVVAKPKSIVLQLWIHSLGMTVTSLVLIINAKLPIWCLILTSFLILLWKKDLINVSKELDTSMAAKLFQSSIVFLSFYSLILVIGAVQISNG